MFKKFFKMSKLKFLSLLTIGGITFYIKRETIVNKLAQKLKINQTISIGKSKIIQQQKKIDSILLDYFNSISEESIPDIQNLTNEMSKNYKQNLEISEYHKSSQAKIKHLYDNVILYDKELKNLNNKLEQTKINIDELNQKEKNIHQEIEKAQNELISKSEALNEKSLQLNTERLELIQLINNKFNLYSNLVNKIQNQFLNNFTNQIDNIEKNKIEPLDLDKIEQISSDTIIKQIKLIKQNKEENMNKQIDFLLQEININNELLGEYLIKLKEYLKQYENLSKTYLEFKHDEYEIKNKIKSLELVMNNNKTLKQENFQKMYSVYKEEHNTDFVKNTYPTLLNLLQVERDSMMKMNSNASKDEILKIQNNLTFLKNSFLSKNLDVMLGLEYNLNKLSSEEIHTQNILKLLKLSKSYNDDFIYDLLQNSNLIQAYPSNYNKINNEFQKLRKNLTFNLLSGRKKNILKVIISPLTSFLGSALIHIYHPLYTSIKENDKDIIKKFKALSSIQYYLRQRNYYKSFYYVQYFKEYQSEIIPFQNMISSRIKNRAFLDLFENFLL